MNPAQFLEAIFQAQIEIEEDTPGFIHIFTLPNKKSQYFSNMKEAGEYAEAQEEQESIYFSIGISPRTFPSKQRPKENQLIGFSCLTVDIDIKCEGHDKAGLPETIEEATELLDAAYPDAFKPSIVTETGGGIQAFWIFKEPWIFEDDDDAEEGKSMFRRWVRWLQQTASGKGLTVDSTISLSQLMRVAGTMNNKRQPFMVKVVRDTGERFNPDELDGLISFVGDELKPTVDAVTVTPNFKLDPNAQPPADKLADLIEYDPNFKVTWHKQADVARQKEGRDTSLSAYDMTLINIAKSWHWTDQEIVNLIIAFRRKHQQKPEDFKKATRASYHLKNLQKAAVQLHDGGNLAEDSLKFYQECVADQVGTNGKQKSKKEQQKKQEDMVKKAKLHIKKNLGVNVEKIHKYMSTPPEYEIVLADGQRVMVGKSSSLLNQEKMRHIIFDNCNLHLVSKKSRAWQQITTYFHYLMEEVDTAPETRDMDAMESWIIEHVEAMPLQDDPNDAIMTKDPFKRAGNTYVFLDRLQSYLKTNKGEILSNKEIGVLMRRCGCNSTPVNFKMADGRRSTRSVYDVTAVMQKGGEHGKSA